MNPITELMSRLVDDRDSLSESEWDTLLAELEKSPTLLAELRDQLQLDDYLAQKLAVDRVNFESQINQRVTDYEQQLAETFDQVAELRLLAEEELTKPTMRPTSSWWSWGMSLAIVAAAALVAVTIGWQLNWGQSVQLATVESVSGDVQVRSGDHASALTTGAAIEARQELITGNDSSLVWRYADGTQIRLEANTTAFLSRHPDHEGKRVQLDRGTLLADIAPQLAGRPMTFVTPHAEAIVVGTKFQLSVREADTELEVTEGIVDFSRKGASEALRVVANEVSHISNFDITRIPVAWPAKRNDDSLAFLFKNFVDPPLARNPESNNMRITPLQERGNVSLWHDQGLSMQGGSYWSTDAGTDLLALLRDRDQLTVEVILGAEEMGPMATNANGTVLALAARGDQSDWALRAQDGQWLALLRTTNNETPQVLSFPMLSASSGLHHVAWTYSSGDWKGYTNGELVGERHDVAGGFQNWLEGALSIGANEDESQSWNGNVFGFAVYRRVLSADELALNARRAKIVYGMIGQ